jgi:hypothetical protein
LLGAIGAIIFIPLLAESAFTLLLQWLERDRFSKQLTLTGEA